MTVAVATALLLLAGCGGKKTDRLSIDDGPSEGGNAITPATLTVKRGHHVELDVKNTATDKAHGFTIEGLDIATTLSPGETKHLKFTARAAGTYRIFCQLHPAHKPAALTVT